MARASTADSVVESVVREGDLTTIGLSGELDLWTTATVRGTLEAECEREPKRLVVDLAAVEFIDSTALHVFVDVYRRLRETDCTLELVGATSAIGRVFSLTKLDELLFTDGQGSPGS